MLIIHEVNADELNLPAEVTRKLKGKQVTIVEVREGFLLKPVEDPVDANIKLIHFWGKR